MARENAFTFIGEVVNVPVALLNEESRNYRITFTLAIPKRNGKVNYPKINVYDLTEEDARKYVSLMRPGVFVILRGMVFTSVVKKPVRCESCGQVSMIDTLQTEIISFDHPYVLKEKLDQTEICEFSNRGIVLGNVCSEVYRRDGMTSGTAAQFQMAISRKFCTKNMKEDKRTDFPWVKVFGKIADECLKRIRPGSQIYMACLFQTRDLERHVKCQNCEQMLIYDERVGEIIPYSIEFLNNCLFEKKEKNEGASGEEKT